MVPSLPPHAAVSTHPQYGVSGGIILLFAKAPHQPRNPVESGTSCIPLTEARQCHMPFYSNIPITYQTFNDIVG
jgi:hypothetical protein